MVKKHLGATRDLNGGRKYKHMFGYGPQKRCEVIAKWLSNVLTKRGSETRAIKGAIGLQEGKERQIMKKGTKFFDFICFVLGPFIVVVSLLSFEHGRRGFYFPGESKIGIAIGIALICIGFLRAYWRKNKKGG